MVNPDRRSMNQRWLHAREIHKVTRISEGRWRAWWCVLRFDIPDLFSKR